MEVVNETRHHRGRMKSNSTLGEQPSRQVRDTGLEIFNDNDLIPNKTGWNSRRQTLVVQAAYNWIRFWQRRWRRGWYSHYWIALLSIGGTTLAASTTTYWSYDAARRSILEQVQENMQLKVEQSADRIDRTLAERSEDLTAIATTTELRLQLTEIVNRLREVSGSHAFIINDRGLPAIASGSNLLPEDIAASEGQLFSQMRAATTQFPTETQGIERVQLQGQWYYLTHVAFQQTDGALALIVPAEAIESELQGLHWLVVIVAGLLAAAPLSSLYWVRASLTARVLQEQESLLNRLTARIRASLELEEILQTTVEEVAKLLEVERVAFCWYDPRHGTLQNWWEYTQKSHLSARLSQIQQYEAQKIHRSERATQCFFVPVPVEGESPGYLILSQAAPWSPTPSEKELLGLVANQLAIAITQSRLYSQTRQQVKRFAHALDESALVAIADERGIVTHINHRLCQLLQYERDEPIGQHHRLFELGNVSSKLLREIYSTLARQQVWKGEVNLLAKGGGTNHWLDLTIFPFTDNGSIPSQYLAVGFEIDQRKQAEANLRHNAYHDELTGLPNRTALMERLDRAIAQRSRHAIAPHPQRQDALFALLFLDLDRFKAINDSLGHLMGDRLLVEIARRLQMCARPVDLLARFGGDEFIFLLDNLSDIEEAIRVAECIQNCLRFPLNLNGYEVFTTTSIGIAISSTRYQQPEEILRDANIAMYQAKAQNRGGYVLFDRGMHDRAIDLMQIECDLRRAVDGTSEFQLYYQPIVCFKTSRVIGFEVLVRWQHPERGWISPSTFIPVAEETQLIVPLGEWVLLEACQQLRRWQDQFSPALPLTLSVNFSGVQLVQADLMERIDRILGAIGLTGRGLKIEITESVMMTNLDAVKAWLKHLRSRQIQVSIDDFGTGYSSLSYLSSLSIDTLKIDRSFIKRITRDRGTLEGRDRENVQIVQAIVSLAHNLGMDVVAEGVETELQKQQLQALGCDCGQGYYFSPPLSSEEATALLARRFWGAS